VIKMKAVPKRRERRAAVAAAVLTPIILAGCVEARPLHLADDNPASPRASEGLVASPAALEAYRTPEQFASAAAEDAKTAAGDGMAGMNHGSIAGMDHGAMPGMQHPSMAGEHHSSMQGMDHSSMPGMKGGTPRAQVAQAQSGGPTGTGKVNSVDLASKKVNVTHQPIQALGWPAMTMDFPVAPSVDLGSVQAGRDVSFTLGKGSNGMYRIESIKPAGGR
jgi:Cu/Ag efflux protein CusF